MDLIATRERVFERARACDWRYKRRPLTYHYLHRLLTSQREREKCLITRLRIRTGGCNNQCVNTATLHGVPLIVAFVASTSARTAEKLRRTRARERARALVIELIKQKLPPKRHQSSSSLSYLPLTPITNPFNGTNRIHTRSSCIFISR